MNKRTKRSLQKTKTKPKTIKKKITDSQSTILLPKHKNDATKTNFFGSPWYNLIVMLYLKFKFPNECVVLPYDGKIIKNPSDHNEISLRYDQKEKRILVPKHFWNNFNKCNNNACNLNSCELKNNRFIVFPLGFNCSDESGHANYVIYDTKTKSMERFEPHGGQVANDKCINVNIDKLLKELFIDKYGPDIILNYYKPIDYLPKIGFQTYQDNENKMLKTDPSGFCAVWSGFFAESRLANPDIDRNELVKRIFNNLKKNEQSLTDFIRNHSSFLEDLSNEIKKSSKNLNNIDKKINSFKTNYITI
jgi:hypothetical protein